MSGSQRRGSRLFFQPFHTGSVRYSGQTESGLMNIASQNCATGPFPKAYQSSVDSHMPGAGPSATDEVGKQLFFFFKGKTDSPSARGLFMQLVIQNTERYA